MTVRWEAYPSGSAIKAYNLKITPASEGDEFCIQSTATACEFILFVWTDEPLSGWGNCMHKRLTMFGKVIGFHHPELLVHLVHNQSSIVHSTSPLIVHHPNRPKYGGFLQTNTV